jgi:DNA invertase Pin-like site-specific DNA recombinase
MTLAVPSGSHGKIYVRVSTMHQAGDELPIESQISELQAAVDAAGATAEGVIDAGISGTDLEGRAGLQSIMAAAREDRPGFTWVLAWKYSRFARNMEEALIYRALLKKRGIDLISYKEPVPDGYLGALITHILMAIDEFYAAATAADVLRSQKELTRQGFSATELSAAHARLDAIPVREKPVTVSDESVAATLAQLRGIAENGSLVDRVAWIRSAFDHVEVFDDHAEAHWREPEEPVTSSIDVSSWLRR